MDDRFTPRAFFLWQALPDNLREAILAQVWCSACRTGVELREYTGRDVAGDVILEGKCPTCGGRVARRVETSERGPTS